MRDIHRRHDRLTPGLVVEEARQVGSPLHDHFEWDDAVAGERFRLVQAGDLIRKFRITYGHDTDGTPQTVREWVSVARPDQPRGYIPTDTAVADPFTREVLKRECLREAHAFKIKYQALEDYAQIVQGLADTG